MESVLQLCESRDARYPDYFQVFLNNCVESYPDRFFANDYLFAAVYFIILECGFCPLDASDKLRNCSDSFDIRKLRLIQSYGSEHMKAMKSDVAEYWVYGIPLTLGNYRCICELQGVPSAENNVYLIINFLSKQLGIVKSLCLNTENYTENYEGSSNHSVKLKNLQELSLVIKDKISNSIKERILLSEGQGCYPNLLRLPEEIQKNIIYNLVGDCSDVLCLSSTCSYFYHVISNDFKLWEILCTSEFDGRLLNEALHELLQVSDKDEDNLFRKVFLKLKKRSLKRGYKLSDQFNFFD